MILISLLLALAIERVTRSSPQLECDYWLNKLANRVPQSARCYFQTLWGCALFAFIPALLADWLLAWTQGMLFGLINILIYTAILLFAIGNSHYRQQYHKFIKAGCRGDRDISAQVANEVREETGLKDDVSPDQQATMGLALLWVNYEYYLAVMLWALVLGPAGVVFYATLRALANRPIIAAEAAETVQPAEQTSDLNEVTEDSEPAIEQPVEAELRPANPAAEQIFSWINWPTVRIAALGYLLVGHFSQSAKPWLQHLFDVKQRPQQFLLNVAMKAESPEFPQYGSMVQISSLLVGLAKRNVLLLLLVIALLSIYGHIW